MKHETDGTYEPFQLDAKDKKGGAHHLLDRQHWVNWEQYGAPLWNVMGPIEGCGMRHMSKDLHRSPFELWLNEMLWAPDVREGCPIPSKDALARHIGDVRLPIPAAWSLLKHNKVQVRVVKNGNPEWRPLRAKDVSALHVGVI